MPDIAQPAVDSIDVVLPAHNEEGSIGGTLSEFYDVAVRRYGLNVRFVVCEDGSTDRTVEVIQELSGRIPILLLSTPQRKGYSRAVVDGLRATTAPYVAFIDSDGQCDPADLTRLTALKDQYDLIMGYRNPRADHWIRLLMSRSFHWAFSFFFTVPFRDPSCPYLLIRRPALERVLQGNPGILKQGFWWEFTARAVAAGLKTTEVPVAHRVRTAGTTQVYKPSKVARIGWEHLLGLFKLRREIVGLRMSPSPLPKDTARMSGFRFVLLLAALFAVAVGVYTRVTRIDQRLFWFDEALTVVKLAGDRPYVAADLILDGQLRSISELSRYQHLNPEHGWLETLKRCAGTDPQMVPLHCMILRFWAPVFGDSVTSLRAFSVLMGLLCLPAIMWLAYEVAGRSGATLPILAVALMAVSPFEVLFSQEMREYSMWTLLVLLTSAALLSAMRTRRRGMWIAYAVLTTIAVYTHLFQLIVLIAHGLFVLRAGDHSPPGVAHVSSLRQFMKYAGAGVATLTPWLGMLVFHRIAAVEALSWTTNPVSLRRYATSVVRNIATAALDFGPIELEGWRLGLLGVVAAFAVLALGMIAWRVKRSPRGSGCELMLLLVLLPPTLLGGADLLLGGLRLTVARYQVPGYVGLTVIFACIIGGLLDSRVRRQQVAGWIGLAAFLAAGTYSCRLLANSDYWWNKAASSLNRPCAALIQNDANPLLIVEPVGLNFGNLLSLSHIVDKRVHIVGEPAPDLDFRQFDHILVYNPSPPFLDRLVSRTGMTPALVGGTPGRAVLYEMKPRL